MFMRKTNLIVLGATLAAFNLGPVLAQDADESDVSVPSAEEVMVADVADAGDAADLMFALLTGPEPIVAAVMPLGSSTLIAEGSGGPMMRHGHEGGGPAGALQGPLALTDDQWEKLWSIHEESQDQLGPKMFQLHTTMRHLMDALADSNQDSKKIKDMQSQIASLKAEISSTETGKMVAMSQVLTPDQRTAIHKMMIRHMLMHKWHHGPVGPGHGRPGVGWCGH